MSASSPRLTKQQIGIIHVAKLQLGLDDDAYRALLQREGRVDGAAKLDQVGFNRVMAAFEAAGFKSTSQHKAYGNRPGFATNAQVGCIRKLWSEYTGGTGTEAQLCKWIESKFKVTALRFLELEVAPDVITALRAMVERRQRERGEAPPAA